MPNLKWEDVDSSNVKQTYFDDKTQTICVKFINGGLYSYIGGNQEMYMSLTHAQSVGKYLNNVIKALPYTRWESEDELIAHLLV